MIKNWMKKGGACLLAVMMMLPLMPATDVHAEAADSNQIWVNGTNIITAADNAVQCGDGTAVYEPAEGTLTLTNAVINAGGPDNGPTFYGINVGIRANCNLNIVLVGENVIGDGENTALGGGIMTDGTLHISGSGNLNINTNRSNRATTHDALDANGAVSIKDAVLTIKDWAASRFSSDNIYFSSAGIRSASTIILDAVTITGENLDSIAVTPDQNITIKNSKMEVTNSLQAINTGGIVTITDSSITGSVTPAGTPGIPSYYYDTGIAGSSVTFDHSTVNLDTVQSNAIFADDTLTIKNNSSVTAKSVWPTLNSKNAIEILDSIVKVESKSGEENAILASNSLTIRNADVTAKSYYPALFSGSTLEIADSTVKAESTADLGIWSKGSLAIKGDSDVVATGTSGSIGALTSATVTPTAGKKVEILVGNDRDSAAAVENSPFAGETDISAYKTNTYFRSKVKAVPPVGGGGTVMPNDNVTNNVTEKTTTADITTTSGTDGKATATVDKITADKIVDKAVTNESKEVIIDATTTKADAKAAEIKLPAETVKALVEKTSADIIFKTDTAEVVFDQKAAEAIAEKTTTGTVSIIVEKVKEDDTQVQVKLKVVTENGSITDFKGGNVKVTLALPAVLKDKKVVCVYIDDEGVYHKVDGTKNVDGTYTFCTGHFSAYAILAAEEADKILAEQEKARLSRIKAGVKATTIKAWSSAKKNSITVKWKKSAGYKVDYYQVFRSTKKNSGYGKKAFYTTKKGTQRSYKNTKALKKGTRYYYKVRGVRKIDGGKVYTKWSNKAVRIAK